MQEHNKCEHKNLKYCKICDVVYCEDCREEWKKELVYQYTATSPIYDLNTKPYFCGGSGSTSSNFQ